MLSQITYAMNECSIFQDTAIYCTQKKESELNIWYFLATVDVMLSFVFLFVCLLLLLSSLLEKERKNKIIVNG